MLFVRVEQRQHGSDLRAESLTSDNDCTAASWRGPVDD